MADGVQYAPHAPVDVLELGVDAYAFSPYKAFCVKGIGFAWLSDRLASLPHWSLEGKPANDWSLGCPENATFAASFDRRQRIVAAMSASQSHLESLLHQLIDGLRSMDHVRLIGVGDELANRVCLALFNIDAIPAAEASGQLHEQGIRVPHRIYESCEKYALESLGVRDALRISACHYNTPEEIGAFLRNVAKMVN